MLWLLRRYASIGREAALCAVDIPGVCLTAAPDVTRCIELCTVAVACRKCIDVPYGAWMDSSVPWFSRVHSVGAVGVVITAVARSNKMKREQTNGRTARIAPRN